MKNPLGFLVNVSKSWRDRRRGGEGGILGVGLLGVRVVRPPHPEIPLMDLLL